MTCRRCKDPDCMADAAGRIEREAYDWLKSYGGKIASDNWKAACEAEEQAQSDCAHRAMGILNADTLARLAAIEARQDRIEAAIAALGIKP